MKKTITAYRCEHCDKIIDPKRQYFINFHALEAEVNHPAHDGEFEVVAVDVSANRYWRREESTAVCSEACLSNWINALAQTAWSNLKTAKPIEPPEPEMASVPAEEPL